MKSVIIAIPNDPSLAERLGKKGSVNSITFYNRKADDLILTILTPSDVEEKYYAVPESILMSDIVILSSRNPDSLFGESLIACSLLGKDVIITDESDVSKLLSGFKLKCAVLGPDAILDYLKSYEPRPRPAGAKRVDIDKAFPVKGVGDILLGFTTAGTISKHDKLLHSSGKEVLIRSIQSQDEDVDSAGVGTRVGLAIKGAVYSDFDKGDVISDRQIPKVSEFSAKVEVSPLARINIDGMACSIASGFSFSNATLKADGADVRVSAERKIAVAIGDRFLLVKGDKPRIFGAGTISKV
ncbi:MAG: hypothetical protein KGH98_02890 [Candidatus Micrarchaeota archaeon]|nr:hypothetical protein [Candidatus Micrarchaeota archaeon]